MQKTISTSDPSTWAQELDAVTAAPKNHKVLFENDRLRVLEVILEPSEEENRFIITGGPRCLFLIESRDPSMIFRPAGKCFRQTAM